MRPRASIFIASVWAISTPILGVVRRGRADGQGGRLAVGGAPAAKSVARSRAAIEAEIARIAASIDGETGVYAVSPRVGNHACRSTQPKRFRWQAHSRLPLPVRSWPKWTPAIFHWTRSCLWIRSWRSPRRGSPRFFRFPACRIDPQSDRHDLVRKLITPPQTC